MTQTIIFTQACTLALAVAAALPAQPVLGGEPFSTSPKVLLEEGQRFQPSGKHAHTILQREQRYRFDDEGRVEASDWMIYRVTAAGGPATGGAFSSSIYKVADRDSGRLSLPARCISILCKDLTSLGIERSHRFSKPQIASATCFEAWLGRAGPGCGLAEPRRQAPVELPKSLEYC